MPSVLVLVEVVSSPQTKFAGIFVPLFGVRASTRFSGQVARGEREFLRSTG